MEHVRDERPVLSETETGPDDSASEEMAVDATAILKKRRRDGSATLRVIIKTAPRRQHVAATWDSGTSLSQLCTERYTSFGKTEMTRGCLHGIQSGDVSADGGVVWARTNQPARMLVEIATTDSFKNVRNTTFVDALPETDFTAKALVDSLPAGHDIFYRIRFQSLSYPTIVGEPKVGHFRTAPSDRRSISFLWSGDTCGQGWGIDEARGGLRTYATMLRNRPDFFIHSGGHGLYRLSDRGRAEDAQR